METLLTNAYTCLDEKSKVFETSSVAIGTKELLQKNLCQKISFITKWHFQKFINRINGVYKIKLWKLSACIKQKWFYYFEDFSQPLAFFCVSKNNQRN